MSRALVASLVVLSVVIVSGRAVGRAQEDPFLALYYNDNGTVTCRDYGTANAAPLPK